VGIDITPAGELVTEMLERQIDVRDDADPDTPKYVTIRYLSHDDFSYVFRGENPLDHELEVIVRVFLAPESEAEDRTAWIEMDRFLWRMSPGPCSTERAADASSVI